MLWLPQEEGQGLVEYALILVLVAIIVIAILLVLGPQIGNVFSRVTSGLQHAGQFATKPRPAGTAPSSSHRRGPPLLLVLPVLAGLGQGLGWARASPVKLCCNRCKAGLAEPSLSVPGLCLVFLCRSISGAPGT
jgi:pilus assembly protein Flp/PilA